MANKKPLLNKNVLVREANKDKKSSTLQKKNNLNVIEQKTSIIETPLQKYRKWLETPNLMKSLSDLTYFVDTGDECEIIGCDNLKTTLSFCRLHYIKYWDNIQDKRNLFQEGEITKMIKKFISKLSEKEIQVVLNDLQNEKKFFKALRKMDIISEIEFIDADVDSDVIVDDGNELD